MSSPLTTTNATVSAVVSTLVPALALAAVYFCVFLYLRKSQQRYYAPRTYLGNLPERERTPELPKGYFNWFGAFWKIPDTWALQHQSLDAYLFLRYLRIIVVITFVGCFITWPVLFPVHATGGPTSPPQQQLDILSFSNIDTSISSGKNRLYAHVFVAWIFFGFILFTICREIIFYINLRQAFLLSPVYANRISSRTVLFTSVPAPYLDEAKLRKVFGSAVKKIWIMGDTSEIDELVEKRDKIAYKLESAEVKLIRLANAERLKAQKKAGPARDEETEAPVADVDAESGSIAARWVPPNKRPMHKLGKFGLYGAKVDTINWCREQLETLIPEVESARTRYQGGECKKIPAVFIEFTTQSEAQAAFQTLSHHQALHMTPRYIGVNPNEVVWKSLKITWWQRVVWRYIVLGFITALIIFWAIPVTAVGLISNISYLETYGWLSWLQKIPNIIMGVVTGLLPSVLLAILMSLVPIIMRLCAKLAGEPTLARVELFTQNAYFAFQVVQVFLVTTLASSASALVKQISDNPTDTPTLLAQNLPKASTFYICYFVLQGLAISSGVLAQVVGFIIFRLMYRYLASTPRSMYQKWTNLSAISWGSTLPVYSNIAVIAIVYAMIAPLVLGFATIGLSLFYLAYRYNILFVTETQIDTKGLMYPRALQHLMTGVYISEVCMIGLFGIATAPGPLILMVIFLVFTVLFHLAMNSALDPLLQNLPKTLEAEEESHVIEIEAGNKASGEPADKPADKPNDGDGSPPIQGKKPSIFAKYFHPDIYADFATLRSLVPQHLYDPNSQYTPEVEQNAYYPPSVASTTPLLWVPKDEAGVSTQEVAHTGKVIPITDQGSSLDEKNKLVWDTEATRPPIWEEKVYY